MVERIARCASLVALLLLTASCGETLFRSDFDQAPAGQPPTAAQGVGTAAIQGSVLVVAPPVTPSGRWVEISRPNPDTNVAAFQGNFSASRGDGEYTFTTTVFMPTGSGVATIQFERFGQPIGDFAGFLHLDLLPDNTVRIDDLEATKFGEFPRDQPFIVQVTLDINESSSAHIVLSGAGAAGTADHAILPPFRPIARRFGAVRLWMGFPHTGRFDATNIVVKRE
ncbi:MAG TPA: hypothetical protein VNJ70_11020 [Thermoanaerobaculia bacterium]|nr:hypothetical protein [Thermoanaerobaculia bacterium]